MGGSWLKASLGKKFVRPVISALWRKNTRTTVWAGLSQKQAIQNGLGRVAQAVELLPGKAPISSTSTATPPNNTSGMVGPENDTDSFLK
jgi:hypothetical protein